MNNASNDEGFELNPFYPTMDSLNKIWGNTVTYAEWCTPLNDVGIISRVLDPSNVTFLEIFTTPNGKPTSLKNRTRQKRTTMDVPATAMKTKNEQDVGSERTSVKADAGKSENRQHGARSKSWNHMLLQYHDSKVRDVVSMRQSVMALRKVKSLNALDIFGVVADDFKKRTRAKDDVLIITEEKDRKHDKNSRSLINIAEERE